MRRMFWAIALLLTSMTSKAQEYYFDGDAEKAISSLLQNTVNEIEGNGGEVCVMETQTGRIVAKVKSGNTTDNEEWLGYYYAPTYIALLETGKVKPTDKVDAGNGIYKDTYDHNWRSGGYGTITLEDALTYSSKVALVKATEQVGTIDITKYVDCNSVWGILTFYNAVANGGKMVKPISWGNTIVINEKIASKENIAHLQRALRLNVADRLSEHAKSTKTEIAAKGRSFKLNSKTTRMEYFGYFPATNPQYTVAVVMEKDGMPTGSALCAPLFKDIAETLIK